MEKIKNYLQLDGTYLDKNQVSHEDLPSFIQDQILGFCGCGDQSKSLEIVWKALVLIKEYSIQVNKDSFSFKDWWDKIETTFHSEDTVYFIWYYLDSIELTSHGGSIFSSWLSEKGEDLLKNLNSIFNKNNLVGYKLKKDIYEEAALLIANTGTLQPHSFLEIGKDYNYHFTVGSLFAENLAKAGVLDLWFEKIYKENELL